MRYERELVRKRDYLSVLFIKLNIVVHSFHVLHLSYKPPVHQLGLIPEMSVELWRPSPRMQAAFFLHMQDHQEILPAQQRSHVGNHMRTLVLLLFVSKMSLICGQSPYDSMWLEPLRLLCGKRSCARNYLDGDSTEPRLLCFSVL